MSIRSLDIEISRLEDLYLAANELAKNAAASAKGHSVSAVDETTGLALRVARNIPVLRETIFVRLISALEVYLIETIRLAFHSRRDLFRRTEVVELTYDQMLNARTTAELLAQIVNDECRKLHSQGFPALRRFYLQRFGIDFGKCSVSITALERLHDTRHLIVHRLGVTDQFFRHKHNFQRARTKLTKRQLLDAFDVTRIFCHFVESEINAIIGPAPVQQTAAFVAKAELANIAVPEVIDPSFTFNVSSQNVVRLADILASSVGTLREHTLILRGGRRTVRAYESILRSHHQRGELLLISFSRLNRRLRYTLGDELLDRIALTLPPRPWPPELHEKIAANVGISRTQAQAALYEIRARGLHGRDA